MNLHRSTVDVLNTLFSRAVKACVNGDPTALRHCSAIGDVLYNAKDAGCDVRAEMNAHNALRVAMSSYVYDSTVALSRRAGA